MRYRKRRTCSFFPQNLIKYILLNKLRDAVMPEGNECRRVKWQPLDETHKLTMKTSL